MLRRLHPGALLLLGLILLASPARAWWDGDWKARIKLSIDNSGQSEDLVDFPLLLVLDHGRINYHRIQDAGQDIRFVDADDATLLAHEIESWDESGRSYVWVEVPVIDAASATDFIWLYYDNASASDGQAGAAVWDNHYVGVWHLGEEQPGTGQADLYRDSSGYDHDGDDHVIATGQEGQVSRGQEFGGGGDYVEVAHSDELNLTGSMTISFWIRPTESTSTFNRVVEKGLWGYQTSYYFGCGNGTNDLTFYLSDTEVIDTDDDVLTVGEWQQAAVSYADNGDAVIYLNGNPIDYGSYAGAIAGNLDAVHISFGDTLYDFKGYIDEVRIADIDRSADWVAAAHLSETDQFLIYPAPLAVDTSNDIADGDTSSVAALLGDRGADGLISLREAISAANNTPNGGAPDEIRFAIPLDDPGHVYYREDGIADSLSLVVVTDLADEAIFDFDQDYPLGKARSWYRLQVDSALPAVRDAAYIDGASQPGYITGGPVLELDGSGSGAGAAGIFLAAGASGSTLRGLIVNRFGGIGVKLTDADANSIEGNFVGTDASGLQARPNDVGVHLSGGSGNMVGGDIAAEGNLIAHNALNGVNLLSGTGNAVLFNNIHSNGLLGIDLGDDGVTENDPGDVDSGPNGLLNFPVITSATEVGGIVTVRGAFDVPAGNYRFEIYLNPSGVDPSGNGEGETYVGSSTITHTGSGAEPFGAAFLGGVGDVVTVTLTEDFGAGTYGSSSEFSDARTVVAPRTIAGTVYEDTDFAGTAENWDGGGADLGLANVDVELYDVADRYIASTATDSEGNYAFTGVDDGYSYKVRVRSATIGDWDTPPAGGQNATVPGTWPYPLAEMTWGHTAALVGGQDSTVDDTDTGDGEGPGDTWVLVSIGGGDVTGVNFGFSYELIVNEDDDTRADNVRSKQGCLRQFIKNANAIAGLNRSWFAIPGL